MTVLRSLWHCDTSCKKEG